MLRSFSLAVLSMIAIFSIAKAQEPHTPIRAVAEETCNAILPKIQSARRDLCVQVFELRYEKTKFPLEPELQKLCNSRASVERDFQDRFDVVLECLNFMDVEEDRKYLRAGVERRKIDRLWCGGWPCART